MTYLALSAKYQDKSNTLQHQLQWLSFLRLVLFAGAIYGGYEAVATGRTWIIIVTFMLLVAFLLLIRLYDKLQLQTAFFKALTKLNLDEVRFLNGETGIYPGGDEYIDTGHPYSYDIDIFGSGGLFSYLNRCSTDFGKKALAQSLLHPVSAEIEERQEAILELKDKLEFRQHLQAHGSLLDTKQKEMSQLRGWLETPAVTSRVLYYFVLLFPLASTSCLVYYFITEAPAALQGFYDLFLVNLLIAIFFTRRITRQLSVSTSVTKILQQYAGQLKQIEMQDFQSPLLKRLQDGLKTGKTKASGSIDRLASLFNYLESVVNLVVSAILNGLFLFHIHILFALEKWKIRNGGQIMPWLSLLGEIEALNSLANLSYNNPDYCRPAVSTDETLIAKDMGHPLIRKEKRIVNSISFSDQRFVILTGSNMSGKSTFLRTLGINLILARMGSVVCAGAFTFYPYAVHVSMRITDSLQDSESFFYAELKRLQAIILQLEAGDKTFVILDEILRGTNSNDKHNGTIGLIHKLVTARACGIIATHDLTVSGLATENPVYIGNKCFESEIINDELLFDYKLKDGVCTRLSASFLMKKMGIIN